MKYVVVTEDGEHIGPCSRGEAIDIVERDPAGKAIRYPLTTVAEWKDQ